jgi:mannose-6-phosphate isomerase-like protein (cupin superfamily)
MDNLEIFEYNGEGYNPTMNFESWRVAIANFGDHFDEERYNYLERHLLTDEVFILLSGEARLVVGCDFSETVMQPGKIYNVKKGAYHALLMKKNAKVLIVENHNTSRENTEYYYFR